MLKTVLLFNVVLFFSTYTHAEYTRKNIVTVVLMVKNEEPVIVKTLQPYIDAGIDSFLVCDTGSTDNTIAVAEQLFKAHDIKDWVIIEEPFVDFSTTRNFALDAAEEHFPNSPFFLMPDAEWYMHNVNGLIDFCVEHEKDDIPCYLMRIKNDGVSFTVPRLIKAKLRARFCRKAHEGIPVSTQTDATKVPNTIYFELGASRYGIEKSRKRWERDLVLLLEEYKTNRKDSRTTFYLAQTYECLEDLPNAYHYYKLRSMQEGWPEENFETFCRLARITEKLSAIDNAYTWHMAQDYYATAHNILPHRAEPLVRIAEHYWPDCQAPLNIPLCYLFARRACEMLYPVNDVLFVDPWIYNFKRYELLSKSAWHVADFENGEIATRKALNAQEMPHLLGNLAAYVGRRARTDG